MTDETHSLLKDLASEEVKKLAPENEPQSLNAMFNVSLNVQVILGQTRLPMAQLLSLSRGSVIELDKRIGQPLEVMINDRLVARGDLVKVGDDGLGITLTEIVKDPSPEVR